MQAVHLRHGKIDDDQIRFEFQRSRDRFLSGDGVSADLPTGLRFQHCPDSPQDRLVIIRNEDTLGQNYTYLQNIEEL